MLYSDINIERAITDGTLAIDGLVPGALQPASVDVHLSDKPLRVWKHSGLVDLDEGMSGAYDSNRHAKNIVPWENQAEEMWDLPFYESLGHGPIAQLLPGQFALASTTERFEIGHKCAGRLEGKSSLARLGLIIHTTAGFFDPGFRGYATLELVNVAPRPILLRPGMPIAQMSFFEMLSTPSHLYDGKYQDQGESPEPSHYDKNFEKDNADV